MSSENYKTHLASTVSVIFVQDQWPLPFIINIIINPSYRHLTLLSPNDIFHKFT